MPKKRKLVTVASIAVSFLGLASTIIYLSVNQTISPQMAKLMLVCLFGLYIGFGILIAVFRLVANLE